jgi:hypothetical protein
MPDNHCVDCGGTGIQIVERFDERLGYEVSGAGPCGCAKGQAIAAVRRVRATAPNPNVTPVISAASAAYATEALSALPFFPASEAARTMIANELRKLCRSEDDVFWLVERMIHLYARWPSVLEMRLVYCSKHFPLDGVVPEQLTTETYPDGIPSEVPTPLLAARPLLPAGRAVSADFQLDAAARELAAPKRLPAATERFPATVTPPRIAVRPEQKHFTPITQRDVEIEVEKLRKARLDAAARQEAGLE